MLIDWVVKLNHDLHIADDKSFEEWGYNDKEILQLMLEHPIVVYGYTSNARNDNNEYPRTTNKKDYEKIIKRVNYYSKLQAEHAKNNK